MTALDTVISAALTKFYIKQYPCIILESGKLDVTDITSALNCVVETYIDEENLSNGMIKLRSGFYIFSPVLTDLDVLGDINPKQEILSGVVREFVKELQHSKFNAKYDGKIVAGIYLTTGMETGKSFVLSFEYYPC